jgi:drug/metabolite transporter (DMT)-like permease
MFGTYGDVATFSAYGTKVGSAALMDATVPVVILALAVAAVVAVRVVTLLQRRHSSTLQPASLPSPSLRVAA